MAQTHWVTNQADRLHLAQQASERKRRHSTAHTRYKPSCGGAKGDTQGKDTSAHCLRLDPCKILLQKSPWYTSNWFTEGSSKEKMVINSDYSWFTIGQTVTEIVSFANNRILKWFVILFMCLYYLFHPRHLYQTKDIFIKQNQVMATCDAVDSPYYE